MEHYSSPESIVKFRGWFVNDEVCLIGWKEEYPPTKEVWQPVFETLLRCGGNIVIPGTDLPKTGIHQELAVEMGLWVTHHHAEPLGAEMFLRAYPNETASYKENAALFEKLWIDAINKQKNDKIIWTLSFRGQGDTPFWSTDPSFDTPQKRGKLISEVVHRQFELIKERVNNPVCCMALYGEISELYKGGYINVPEDVIKVWADNGYGKMVSRRQENENLRISSLPMDNDTSPQGIYYHVTFHDLQASNHLTMTPLPIGILTNELENVLETGGKDLWLINSGNIRQHLYPLDLIKEMWKKGKINSSDHRGEFLKRTYASDSKKLSLLYEKYSEATLYFGNHEDEKAGEQFYHHPARRIISHWLSGETDTAMKSLKWATGEMSFEEQITWFKDRLTVGLTDLQLLREQANEIMDTLSEENKQRFHDQLMVSIILHESGCRGFLLLLKG